MPRVNIFIRDEDYENWLSIKDRPTFIHNAIQMRESYLDLSDAEKKELKQKLQTIAEEPTKKPQIHSLDEYDEVWGSLDSEVMVFSEGDQWIFNKDTAEPLEEITPAQVKWLKKRGQVR